MDTSTVEKLRPHCSDTEWAELSTKHSGYVAWLGAYRKDPNRHNLAELDAAKKSLTATVREIEGRIDAAAADAEPLPNLKAVVDFLKNDGWKIAKSKMYNDARNGSIKVNADGTVNEAEAIAYAHRYLKKIKASEGEKDEMYQEKARAELDLLRVRAAKASFEHDRERGLYLFREDVERETSIKIGLFEAGVKNMVRINADDWVYKVGGDPAKAPIFRDLIFAEFDRLLGDFGDLDEINVVIKKTE